MTLVMECVVPVHSDKEGFLLYTGANGSKKEGFTFPIFSFIPYKNKKHNKKRQISQ